MSHVKVGLQDGEGQEETSTRQTVAFFRVSLSSQMVHWVPQTSRTSKKLTLFKIKHLRHGPSTMGLEQEPTKQMDNGEKDGLVLLPISHDSFNGNQVGRPRIGCEAEK